MIDSVETEVDELVSEIDELTEDGLRVHEGINTRALKCNRILRDQLEVAEDQLDVVERENDRLLAERHNACEECGSTRHRSGPPDCPRCGAPQCCEMCCNVDYFASMTEHYRKKIVTLTTKGERQVKRELHWIARLEAEEKKTRNLLARIEGSLDGGADE